MSKIEIDTNNLEWYWKPLLAGMLLYGQDLDELKRYAELAEIDKEPQELEDKKPLG